ncbi:MAG: hypothetical protein FWC43_13615 [Planctomycetaceae bacterium]|nr:hypothetical protein [Planctomycetaceae bacterium]
MKKTLFPVPKDLLRSLHQANSEATVRQLVIQQLDCEDFRLEEGNADAFHKNILIEFKHDEDMRHKEGDRAPILAQALYYCHNFFIDGKPVPPYVALVDKDEFVFYNREALEPVYKELPLFRKGNASRPDEAVIEKCKQVEPLKKWTICSLIDVWSHQIFVIDEIDRVEFDFNIAWVRANFLESLGRMGNFWSAGVPPAPGFADVSSARKPVEE